VSKLDQLLERAKSGDDSVDNEIFEHLSVRFKIIAKRRVREEHVEDVSQEACATVLEKYKEMNFTTGFEQWAYGILRNKIGNLYQKKSSSSLTDSGIEEREPNVRNFSELDPALKTDLLHCMKKIMKTQNIKFARVLNLSHQGFETEEICEKLAIKSNYMYVLLNRSREMLRSCLDSRKK
jgi:RNA polymerase sigma factor (sigma-70 family)